MVFISQCSSGDIFANIINIFVIFFSTSSKRFFDSCCTYSFLYTFSNSFTRWRPSYKLACCSESINSADSISGTLVSIQVCGCEESKGAKKRGNKSIFSWQQTWGAGSIPAGRPFVSSFFIYYFFIYYFFISSFIISSFIIYYFLISSFIISPFFCNYHC